MSYKRVRETKLRNGRIDTARILCGLDPIYAPHEKTLNEPQTRIHEKYFNDRQGIQSSGPARVSAA